MNPKLKALLPYLFTVLAVSLPWFFQRGYLFSVDYVFGPVVPLDWRENWFLPNLGLWLVSKLAGSAVAEKLFYSFCMFIVLWGGRQLAKHFLQGQWPVFAISLFALFNPFVYDRLLYGQVGVVAAFGFLLLSAAALLTALRENKPGRLVLAGLYSGCSILFSPHFLFFNIVVWAVLYLAVFLQQRQPFSKTYLAYALAALAVVLALNANWLYASLSSASSTREFLRTQVTEQDLEAFQTAGSSAIAAATNVLLMSGFWGKDQFRYQDLADLPSFWGRSFLLLLPILLYGVWRGLGNKNTRWITAGALALLAASFVLALGIRMPAARQVTLGLFNNLPFYKGLRETQKWVSVEILAYVVLLSIGLRELLLKKFFSDNRKTILAFLTAVTVMQAPLLLWGFYGQLKAREYPAGWRDAKAFLTDQGCPNSLMLPWHLYMSFAFTGKVVVNPAKNYFDCKIYTGTNMEYGGIYDNSGDPNSAVVADWLEALGHKPLGSLGVRYILLAKEADFQDYYWLELVPGAKVVRENENFTIYELTAAQ